MIEQTTRTGTSSRRHRDDGGNRTGMEVKDGGVTVASAAYEYDELNRLTAVSEGGKTMATYSYDENGNCTGKRTCTMPSGWRRTSTAPTRTAGLHIILQ